VNDHHLTCEVKVLRLGCLALGVQFRYQGVVYTKIKHYHYNATDGVHLFELPLRVKVEVV
jgi:hypothetical protein